MKYEIKLLKVCYIVIIVVGFLLYFYYTNNKENEIVTPNYSYEIININETNNKVTYEVNITAQYKDDILKEISEEIKTDYEHLYQLNDVNEKVKEFDILYYYENKLYKEVTNKK